MQNSQFMNTSYWDNHSLGNSPLWKKDIQELIFLKSSNRTEIELNMSNNAMEFYESNAFKQLMGIVPEWLMLRVMMSGVLLRFQEVLVSTTSKDNNNIPNGDYIIASSEINWLIQEKWTEIRSIIYRAFSLWNLQREQRAKNNPVYTPIVLLDDQYCPNTQSLKNEDFVRTKLPYMCDVKEERRVETYRAGHIAHEIWHHWFLWRIEWFEDMMSKWESFVTSLQSPITSYVSEYKNNRHLYLDESFAEFFRLLLMHPRYLRTLWLYDWFTEFLKKSSLSRDDDMADIGSIIKATSSLS